MSNADQTQYNLEFFRFFFAIGALLAALSIILSALDSHLPDQVFAVSNGRNLLHTATEIMIWHAIALCIVSLGNNYLSTRMALLSCVTFFSGTVLFCLPIILFAFWNLKIASISITRIAPYGGSILIVSWIITAISALKKKD